MTMLTDPPATTGPHEPRRPRRRRAIVGAAAAVAAGATVWAVAGHHGHSTTPAAAYESACGLHGGSTGTPTTTPATQWQNVDGNWLPVSASQGPGSRPPTGLWSCYAHTPTGAVLAAWDIPARAEGANFAAVVQQQTVPGPGQAALLKQGPENVPANQLPVPVGFQINAYDAAAATITFYVQQQGLTVRCATGVQWVGGAKGDWRLLVNPDGSARSGCQQIPADLSGQKLVVWGPNS